MRSPYGNGGPNSPGSPFSSSSDTLIGSPNNRKYANPWSPNSSYSGAHPPSSTSTSTPTPASPSIKNLQLAVPFEDKTAHPDNDRLMVATPTLASQSDWWKRFSMVAHLEEERQQMGEKVNHNSTSSSAKVRSSWLDRENGKQRNYRIWVGIVALLIIAAIAGGVAYHFVTKDDNEPSAQPKKQDFGLGTLSDEPSSSTIAAGEDLITSDSLQPAPSSVPAGAILRRTTTNVPTHLASLHNRQAWQSVRDGLVRRNSPKRLEEMD